MANPYPTIEPDKKCNGRKHQWTNEEPYCRQVAGYRTVHVGLGRCVFHGGGTPIKHGRSSKLLKYDVCEPLRKKLERLQEKGDLYNLDTELVILQKQLEDILKETGDTILAPKQRRELQNAIEAIAAIAERAYRMAHVWTEERADAFMELAASEYAKILREEYGDSDQLERVKLRLAQFAEEVMV